MPVTRLADAKTHLELLQKFSTGCTEARELPVRDTLPMLELRRVDFLVGLLTSGRYNATAIFNNPAAAILICSALNGHIGQLESGDSDGTRDVVDAFVKEYEDQAVHEHTKAVSSLLSAIAIFEKMLIKL